MTTLPRIVVGIALVSGCATEAPPDTVPEAPPRAAPAAAPPAEVEPARPEPDAPNAIPAPEPEPVPAPDVPPAPEPDPAATAARARVLQAELALLGAPAPALTTQAWIQGQADDLAAGKATLVVFFATEAPDAPPAVGAAEALWRRAKSRGLHVVGVASDARPRDAVTAWLRAEAVTFPVALDREGQSAAAYRRSSPVSAVLVKDGRVVWTGNPARVTEELLARHL